MKSNIISGQVGTFLRKARKEKNMTGKQLAKLIGISQQQISRYEMGITAITLDQLDIFLSILDKRWVDVIKYVDSEVNSEREKDSKENIGRYISWKSYSTKTIINNC
ncbi:helix-turn-helix domain-containing protein [Providencia sp. wls1943]|uniref:helix-turn-helix domain-containing protein n=1 Tax=Providencia sp. wls1943 TaxID=2675150 RepID=UPI0012B5B0BA|nr:helix-turn-helix transcriptional regulator [Providencia sp. wls1943]MTB65389.1 helix-turn-helix domain-containing protein [Providencia sp. wls1943]